MVTKTMCTKRCSYVHMHTRAHDKKFKVLGQIPDKHAIARTYQTIFRHYIIIITVINTLYVAMQYVWMRGHVVQSLNQLVRNPCKVL